MPLETGKSREAFEHNVKEEISAGKPQSQAVAIAYSKQRGDAIDMIDAAISEMSKNAEWLGQRMDAMTIRSDAKQEELKGGKWITSENGHKIYIKNGKIVAGAGGKFNGQNIDELEKSSSSKEKNTEKTSDRPEPRNTDKKEEDRKKETSHFDSYKDILEIQPSMSDRQKKAMETYKDFGSDDINIPIREDGVFNKDAKDIREYLDKTSLKTDLTVYRSIGKDYASDIISAIEAEGNPILQDKAFMSTTLNKDYHYTGGGIRLEIHSKKGQKGAACPEFEGGQDEYEILFQAGSKFKIKSFDEKTRTAICDLIQD